MEHSKLKIKVLLKAVFYSVPQIMFHNIIRSVAKKVLNAAHNTD